MIPVNLILTIVGLLFLLLLLVAIYVWGNKKKAALTTASSVSAPIETFESLCAIIRNRTSAPAQLNHAVEAIVGRFVRIERGSLGIYTDLIERLCLHPSTNSKLILTLDKALRNANPEFAEEIEHAISRGLSARG